MARNRFRTICLFVVLLAWSAAAELAALLGRCGVTVRRGTISKWKSCGIIRPIGMEGDKPVYRLWDIWQAANRGLSTYNTLQLDFYIHGSHGPARFVALVVCGEGCLRKGEGHHRLHVV